MSYIESAHTEVEAIMLRNAQVASDAARKNVEIFRKAESLVRWNNNK